MYLELLTAATAIQQDLATAYTQTDRLPVVGQYFHTVNMATVLFFEQIEPPADCREVHQAFLEWQKLGQAALVEEIEAGEPVDTETTRHLAKASQRFIESMVALVKEAHAVSA